MAHVDLLNSRAATEKAHAERQEAVTTSVARLASESRVGFAVGGRWKTYTR